MSATEGAFAPRAGVGLAPLTTLGVGGPARYYGEARSPEDVVLAHRWCEAQRVALFVLGGGSNLVISDDGLDGLVLRVAMRGVSVTAQGTETLVTAAAGEPWDPLVQAVVARGLRGLECLSGIPGTVGGTPIQNVGAYGQDVSEAIDAVTVFDREAEDIRTLAAAECGFAYRMSRFKQADAGRFIVCAVTFRLRSGGPTIAYPDVRAYLRDAGVASPSLADVRDAVLAIRRRKGMVIDSADADTRSVGSFFMNPVVPAAVHARVADTGVQVPAYPQPGGTVKIPAAWLIEQAGFGRGHGHGAVGLSSKHPLALVNRGRATARDVLRFAAQIKRRVVERFGIALRPEPVFVGFFGDPDVEYLLRPHVDTAD